MLLSKFRALGVRSSYSSSLSLLNHRLLSVAPSSRSPPHSPSKSDTIPSSAAELADVDDEENDLVCPVTSLSSADNVSTAPILLQPRVVLYDGVCHLCHRGVKWVIEKDKHRKIKFCCLQSKTVDPYLRLSGLDREDVLRRFVFVEGPGLVHQGSAAALKVLSYLPLPYSALSSLSIIPTPLRDAIYDYVAQRRYDWCGKANHCLVLEETELLERFIDRDELIGRE